MITRLMRSTIFIWAGFGTMAVFANPSYRVPAVPLVWIDAHERLQEIQQLPKVTERQVSSQKPQLAVQSQKLPDSSENLAAPSVPLVWIDVNARLETETQKNQMSDVQKRSLPSYSQSAERAQEAKVLKQTKTSLRARAALQVTVPARRPAPGVRLSRQGVPIVPMQSSPISGKGKDKKRLRAPIISVPLVDIGSEEQITAQTFRLESLVVAKPIYGEPKRLASRPPYSDSSVKPLIATKISPRVPTSAVDKKHGSLAKAITLKQVQSVGYQIKAEAPVQEKPAQAFTADEEMLLTALLLFKDGSNCEAVIGMFDKLKSSPLPGVKQEASYHVGICAGKLGLISEQFSHLLGLVKAEDPYYAPLAVNSLLSKVPYDQEVALAETLHGLKNKRIVSGPYAQPAAYQIAKGLFRKGKYAEAEAAARQIDPGSAFYARAQYILSLAQVMRGQTGAAIKTQETLLGQLSKGRATSADKDVAEIKTLLAVNLARSYFEKGMYEKALEYFRQISPDHPLRLQTLVELGWSQLNAGDFSGAVGNMHSIQIPRYSLVYQPESHVVRTIGYLKMCQYGDAYRALRQLEHRYEPWLKKMVEFKKQAKGTTAYYEAVRAYVSQGRADAEVNGLPPQVIRELARHKKFLNLQSAMNQKIAERDQGLERVAAQIQSKIELTHKKEAQAQASLSQIRAQLGGGSGQGKKSVIVNRTELERELRHHENVALQQRYLRRVLRESLSQFQAYKGQMAKRIDKELSGIRREANLQLSTTMNELIGNLGRMLENNELLKYEVYAGAGENIRYRVAGGEGQAPRIPAAIQDIEKNMNWNFEGEVWADEIGHFRSNLKNLCGKNNMAEVR